MSLKLHHWCDKFTLSQRCYNIHFCCDNIINKVASKYLRYQRKFCPKNETQTINYKPLRWILWITGRSLWFILIQKHKPTSVSCPSQAPVTPSARSDAPPLSLHSLPLEIDTCDMKHTDGPDSFITPRNRRKLRQPEAAAID